MLTWHHARVCKTTDLDTACAVWERLICNVEETTRAAMFRRERVGLGNKPREGGDIGSMAR